METYKVITEALLGGAPETELADIISEAIEPGEATETSLMSYLLKFEEFLDSRDVYAFDGWEDAEVVGSPEVGKFWLVVDLKVDSKVDLRGAKRIIGKNRENRVGVMKSQDGGYTVRFKVLRRLLDKIEHRNRQEATREALRTQATPDATAPSPGGMATPPPMGGALGAPSGGM